jgi:hypothetical protein
MPHLPGPDWDISTFFLTAFTNADCLIRRPQLFESKFRNS